MVQSLYKNEEQIEVIKERKEVSKMIQARSFRQILEESYTKEQIELFIVS